MLNQLIKEKPYLVQFSIVAAIVFAIVLGLFSWFIWRIYSIEENYVTNQLEAETGRIEQSFNDTIEHTEFIMKMMTTQIKPNYEDKEYINGIMAKYRTNPNLVNVLSWTMFSWADSNNLLTVDALYGVLDEPLDLTTRDYIPKTINEPGKLHLGKPVYGSTSGRWVIPGGLGVVDEQGDYIGAMTIGFDIKGVVNQFKSLLKTEGIDFALIDSDLDVIIKSSDRLEELGSGESKIPEGELKEMIRSVFSPHKNNVFSKADVLNDGSNYYLYKIQGQPYAIYASYNKQLIKYDFWKELGSRFIEILTIGTIALLLSFFIYRRESKLRKEAQEAHKEAVDASKAKSEFLAYTNHELRSPLNVIIMGADMIERKMFGEISEKYIEYAGDIRQHGEDLLEFIEDLLDAAQVEEGSFSISQSRTDIADTVRRAVNLNITRATKNKITIKQDIEKDLPKLWADRKRLRQIINNLISNSIKYSPPKTAITISAKMIDSEMHISVQDQGYGMTEQEINVAMSKYGTVRNKNSDMVEAIGLGLPLVKKLVDAHGAQFNIQSEPENGTKITIVFPEEYLRK